MNNVKLLFFLLLIAPLMPKARVYHTFEVRACPGKAREYSRHGLIVTVTLDGTWCYIKIDPDIGISRDVHVEVHPHGRLISRPIRGPVSDRASVVGRLPCKYLHLNVVVSRETGIEQEDADLLMHFASQRC